MSLIQDNKTVPILNSTLWNGVNYMIFFLGHSRSGTTLVGSLLDAHPNIIVANEYNAIEQWMHWKKNLQTRDYLFQALYTNSFEAARKDKRGPYCPTTDKPLNRLTHVPNQWQGKFDKHIKVIGDKKAAFFTSLVILAPQTKETRNILPSIQEAVKVPIKFIYVLRNPFDIAATKVYHDIPLSLRPGESERYKLYENPLMPSKGSQLKVVNNLVKFIRAAANYTQYLGDQAIKVYSEDFIKNPTKELKRFCQFLEVSCSEDYLKDCSSIVSNKPSKTRNTIIWDDEAKNIINTMIQEVPLYKRYNFDD